MCESQCPHYKSIGAPIQPTYPAEKYGSVRLYVSYALKVTKCIGRNPASIGLIHGQDKC